MKLENLTVAELRQLLQDLPAEIRRREATERKAVVAEMRALATARGFDFEELLAGSTASPAPAKHVRKPVPVKFRHPKDSSLTWTGRGRKPTWVVQWLASGQPLTALVV